MSDSPQTTMDLMKAMAEMHAKTLIDLQRQQQEFIKQQQQLMKESLGQQPLTPAKTPTTRRAEMPERIDGSDPERVRNWAAAMRMIIEAEAPLPVKLGQTIVVGAVKGAAFTFATNHVGANPDADAGIIVDAIEKTFAATEPMWTVLAKACNLRRSKFASWPEYTQAVDQAVARLRSASMEDVFKAIFLGGIDTADRAAIVFPEPATFVDAKARAHAFNAATEKPETLKAKTKCGNCGKIGHASDKCWSQKNGQRGKARPKSVKPETKVGTAALQADDNAYAAHTSSDFFERPEQQ